MLAGLGACCLLALLFVLLSLDRGIELRDESAYIYLLGHPEVVAQYADHRLWGLLGASVAGYRALALILTAGSAAFLTHGALRALAGTADAPPGRWPAAIRLATLIGALGYFSVIRPTMNYGTTAVVGGNLFVGLLLWDLARAPARPRLTLPLLLGASLALMTLGRFTALPIGVALLLGHAAVRPASGWRVRAVFALAGLASIAAALLVLDRLGFALGDAVRIGLAASGTTHRLSAFLPRDLALLALMAGVGVAAAIGTRVAARLGGARLSTAATIGGAALLLVAALVDQRAVIAGPAPGPSPFSTNTNLYGTTYAVFALAAWLVAFWALGTTGRWRAGARLWLVLAMLSFACLFSLVGTNTGLLARAALNEGPLFAVLALAAAACVRRGLLAPVATTVILLGTAAVAGAFIFLNTLWSPYNVNGGWSRQSVVLHAPTALRGLHVSPGVARLTGDLHTGLTRLGFDPARDRLLFGYEMPGLATLAGGATASPPWVNDAPGAAPLTCAGIAAIVAHTHPRRLYGLNLDYRPELQACLAAHGIDLASARRVRASPLLVITVVPLP